LQGRLTAYHMAITAIEIRIQPQTSTEHNTQVITINEYYYYSIDNGEKSHDEHRLISITTSHPRTHVLLAVTENTQI